MSRFCFGSLHQKELNRVIIFIRPTLAFLIIRIDERALMALIYILSKHYRPLLTDLNVVTVEKNTLYAKILLMFWEENLLYALIHVRHVSTCIIILYLSNFLRTCISYLYMLVKLGIYCMMTCKPIKNNLPFSRTFGSIVCTTVTLSALKVLWRGMKMILASIRQMMKQDVTPKVSSAWHNKSHTIRQPCEMRLDNSFPYITMTILYKWCRSDYP